MEIANENLMKELNRKDSMINRYELDIHELKENSKLQEAEFHEMTSKALENDREIEFLPELYDDILKMQEDIRNVHSENTKLKHQYQKLYELLCSSTSKNIREVFNDAVRSETMMIFYPIIEVSI